MMRRVLLLLSSFYMLTTVQAQELTSEELLSRSIAFHDPDGLWQSSRLEFVLKMESPQIASRTSRVIIDNKRAEFHLSMINGGRVYEFMVNALDSCEVKVDYQKPTVLERDSLNLNADRGRRWRDYYGYLYGLPMKLKDPGTVIDPAVISTTFIEEEVLALKVTYEEGVGEDIWYFYFSPETYAMVGYRFYHDESINDGEYITLSGIEVNRGLRIPKDRAWYTNKEGRLLGVDVMRSLNVSR